MTENQFHSTSLDDVAFIGESEEWLSQYDDVWSNSASWSLVEDTVASSSALHRPHAPATTCGSRFDLGLNDSCSPTPEGCEEAQTITPTSTLESSPSDAEDAAFFADWLISPIDATLSAEGYPSSSPSEHQEGTDTEDSALDLFAELVW